MKILAVVGACLMLLSGCIVPKTYNQIAYNGMPKYQFFDEASWQSLDFQQVYYDEKTKIEVFFLRSANWWNESDVGIISVFESVTNPTQCPFTSRGGSCPYILYPDSPAFDRPPFMGNGQLKDTYRTDELAKLTADGDIEASYLLAAYEIYNDKRNNHIRSIMARNNWDDSSRNRAEYEWYEQGKVHDELIARRKMSKGRSNSNLVESHEKLNRQSTRVPESGHPTDSNIGSDFLDSLIDAAITGWVYKALDLPLPGEVSDSDLKKIEEASRRGMTKALRKSNQKKRTNDKLKTKPKIGCESYGC